MFRLYHKETWPTKHTPSHRTFGGTDKAGKDEAAAAYEYDGFPAHLADRLPGSMSISPDKLLAKLREYDIPYTELGREKSCMLCLALIEQGIAPGLLELRSSVNRAKELSAEQKNDSNDRQVLDLYWLFRHRKADVTPKTKDLKALFDGKTFDFELASKIVSRSGQTAYKARNLVLHEDLEIELMAVRSPETRTMLKLHRKRRDQLEKELSARASKPRSKIDRTDLPKYLTEFKCLDLANGSPKRAAELWSMMTGEPCTPQLKERLRNRRRWLEGEMGIVFKSEGDERS